MQKNAKEQVRAIFYNTRAISQITEVLRMVARGLTPVHTDLFYLLEAEERGRSDRYSRSPN
jgi:hypothetical protein